MGKHDYRVTGEKGFKCPRCDMEAQVREHTTLREKHFKQPFYYSKWFKCVNPKCQTTTFMRDEYKVWNNNKAAQNFKLVAEDIENRERISKLF